MGRAWVLPDYRTFARPGFETRPRGLPARPTAVLPALLRAQLFACKRQSTPLTGGKRDPRATRGREHDILHSTLALEHGASAHVVASSLGHESFSTTVAHYAKPEAITGARQRKVLTVLDGGGVAS